LVEPPLFEIVDCETAKQRKGLRLVIVGAGPSPWSEAAKALFRVKRIATAWVRFSPKDEAVMQWTGSHNAPVAIYDDDPPRTHWSDLVMLAERLGGACSLVPAHDEERARMFGLIHEIAGEDGLGWNTRAMAIEASLASEGTRGFPDRLGKYLHRKYAARDGGLPRAKARVVAVLKRFATLLAARTSSGEGTFLSHGLSALDLYVVAALWMVAPPSDEICPMAPPLRAAATYLAETLGADVPPILVAQRDWIYEKYMSLPLVF